MVGFAIIPGIFGAYGVITTDFSSKNYKRFLDFSGFWIGISGAFFGAAMTGVEVLQYNPELYAKNSSLLFVRSTRLFASFSQIPLGVYCIYSMKNENWKGLLFYLIAHEAINSYQAYSSKLLLMPK